MKIPQQRVRTVSIWPLLVVIALACNTATQVTEPWPLLRHQTAWVYLGAWDTVNERWGTRVNYLNENHPVDQRRVITGEFGKPGIADVLRVTHRWQLVILGFQVSGEQRNLESPTDDVPMSLEDDTKLWLEPGARVKVAEVTESDVVPLRSVWARVTPVD